MTNPSGEASRASLHALIVALALVASTTLYARPSDLNASFGYDENYQGYTRVTDVNSAVNQIKGLVIDADEKITLVGEIAGSGNTDVMVARFNDDGTPDTSFGSNGFAAFDVNGNDDAGYEILRTGGGKYLIAGTAEGDGVVLLRLSADGSLDTSFGSDGFTLWGDNGYTPPISLTELSDGSIVLAKNAYLVWFDSNGEYQNQQTVYDFTHYEIQAHGSGSDERIYALGYANKRAYAGAPNEYEDNMALFAYQPDGTADIAFGDNGLAVSGALINHDFASIHFSDLVVDSKGRIVGLAYDSFEKAGNYRSYDIYVARFTADGQLDTAFNADDDTYGGGVIKLNGPSVHSYSKDKGHALTIQDNDKILVAGESGQNSSAVARLNADGTPDVSFASGGLATQLPYGTAAAFAIGVQSDGRISVAGGDKLDGPKNPVLFQLWGEADPNADTTPPTLIGQYPGPGSEIDPDDQQFVGAVFDEEMDYATVEDSLTVSCNGGSALSGTYNGSSGAGGTNYSVYLNFDSKLPYEAACDVSLSGSVSDTSGNALGSAQQWSFTTGPAPAVDTTPDAFGFNPVSGAAYTTEQTSNAVTISGINSVAAISVSGGSYSIGCNTESYTTGAGTIENGEIVCVRHTSASQCLTETTTQLNVGGVVGEFVSTTGMEAVDADNDGVYDCIDDAPGDNTRASPRTQAGDSVVIATDAGSLQQVAQVDDPSTKGTVPAKATFPYGAQSYNVTGLNPGDTVTVSIDYPSLQSDYTVYKCCDADSAYYEFSGASISGNQVTLTLTDGGDGDADGTVNGTIEDPIAIASTGTTSDSTPTAIASSGGGGAAALATLLPMLAVAGLARLRRRHYRVRPARLRLWGQTGIRFESKGWGVGFSRLSGIGVGIRNG